MIIMRNGNFKLKQFAMLGTIILLSFFGTRIISLSSDVKSVSDPRSSGFWEEDYIVVDNAGASNWATTESTYDWCSGSGTELDPYVIQNVTVNRQTLGPAIQILNSHGVYFKILNCTASTSTDNGGYGGISITGSDNGIIIENNLSGGNGTGIVLSNSNNITIRDNFLSNNKYHGILFNGIGGSCDENIISGNTIFNNSGTGIYLNANNSLSTIEDNLIDGAGNQLNGISISNFGDFNIISGNIIQDCTSYGIRIGNTGSADYLNSNRIEGNTLIGGSRGIVMEADGSDNVFLNNELVGQSLYGLYLKGDNSEPGLKSSRVENNDILHGRVGMVMDRYTENTLIKGNLIFNSSSTGLNLYTYSENNTVINNTINLNKQGIWLQYSDRTHPIINNTINYNTEYGINGYLCENQTILDNIIQFNNISGIYLFLASENIISGNIITNTTQTGVQIFQSHDNFLLGNIISMNQQYGVLVNESYSNIIVGNRISDNGLVGLRVDSSNYTDIHDNLLGGNLVCINVTNSEGTIEYDNICILIDPDDPIDDGPLSFTSVLEALTETEGLVIGGSGLGIGVIISAILFGRKKKKNKKK